MRASRRPDADVALREQAGRLYQQHLDRWMLTGLVEPALAADPSLLRGAVLSFLDELAKLYGVRSWTTSEFERAVLRGALAGWRPGTILRRTRDGWQTNGAMCPLGALTEVDLDACRQCRSFLGAVAAAALGDRAARVSFHTILAAGEGACETVIRTRRAPADAHATDREP